MLPFESFLDELEKISVSTEWLRRMARQGGRRMSATGNYKKLHEFSKRMSAKGTPRAISARQSAHASFTHAQNKKRVSREAAEQAERVLRPQRPSFDELLQREHERPRGGMQLTMEQSPRGRRDPIKAPKDVRVVPGATGASPFDKDKK